ncbi:hypothetical protein D3C72_2351790 [compost metagenome]
MRDANLPGQLTRTAAEAVTGKVLDRLLDDLLLALFGQQAPGDLDGGVFLGRRGA